MMGRATKPEQKRLDRCVLEPPKWDKINENLGKRACRAVIIDDFAPNVVVKLENNGKICQYQTTSRGKYRIKAVTISVSFVISTKNRPEGVRQAVISVLAALPVDGEVIVDKPKIWRINIDEYLDCARHNIE